LEKAVDQQTKQIAEMEGRVEILAAMETLHTRLQEKLDAIRLTKQSM